MKRTVSLVLIVLAAAVAPEAVARELSSRAGYSLVRDLDSPDPEIRQSAKRRLIAAGDSSLAAALVEMIFFSPNGRADAVEILEHLLGEPSSSERHPYKRWLEEIGRREEIDPKRGYVAFKANLYRQIDPAFAEFLQERHPRRIRPEEIVFGGVVKDGIPALDRSPHVAAEAAGWLRDDELVFGVVLDGEARAYPRRILDWHEMANDVLAGRPFSLTWCTLCGSAILFETTVGETVFTFGTSGLLYRSNKLMYDRQTNTLWSQMWGEPVLGPLAESGIRLKALPLVATTWGDWRRTHPYTTVVSTRTGFDRDYARPPYADYFSSDRLMFPVWKRRDDLPEKELVWTLEVDRARKAWRLEDLRRRPVLADRVGTREVVLLTDPNAGAVRAYEGLPGDRFVEVEPGVAAAGDHPAAPAESVAGTESRGILGDLLVTESGRRYRVTEEALVGEEDGARLVRLPGHAAFWFGWFAFHPDTELYSPE
jgi:hypothetical protein